MMRAYELMVIIDGDVEDTAAQAWVKSITDSITKAGGTVHGKPDWWGRRQFAYPINKKEYGYYVVFNLLAPGGALDELERSLRLADDIVRHKLIRLPDAEAARRGLAGSRGLTAARHSKEEPPWPTTPSPSSATSPATPSCASPPAARAWPASASPSTAATR